MTALNAAGAPPLGVYVHWPYCARICPYCDFAVVRDRGRGEEQARLVDAIAADLQAHAALTGPRRLVSIFFGGGTPSLMAPAWIERLTTLCRSLWPSGTADPLEVTLEANPTDAEALRFKAFAAAGINRLSLGVQALDDASLRFLGRNHDAASALRAIGLAQAVFPRVSLDLIYALPSQTAPGWREALERACALGPEHLSPYQLSIEAGTPFDRAVRRGRFRPAEPELAASLYEVTQAVLEAASYHAYEVSNHARGTAARARHNLVYWRGEDYVGVGPSAHGRLTQASGRVATEAEPRIADYIAKVEGGGAGWAKAETLDVVDAAEERVLMGLRSVEGVRLLDLGGIEIAARARDLLEAGLLRRDEERLYATPEGRLVLDGVTAALLA